MSVQAALTGSPSPPVPGPHATAQQIKWVNQVLPYALAEQKRTGIPAEVFIVQSGFETGWGTSGWWTQNHNPAGIGVTGAPGAGNSYVNLQQAFDDYGDKLLGKGEAGQQTFVADVNRHASVMQLLTDLQNSPWAASHYNHSALVSSESQLFGSGSTTAGGVPQDFAPSSGGGQQAQTTNVISDAASTALGGLFGIGVKAVPGLKGVVDAGKTAVAVETFIVGIFSNWRFVLEVMIGTAMILTGVLLVAHDIGATKGAGKAVQSAGAIAAVAA